MILVEHQTGKQGEWLVDWEAIDTVLLDMDGTLLDLHFDNFFWQEHLPKIYASLHDLSHGRAQFELQQRFDAVQGTLNWYCLDYWQKELGLDIASLKHDLRHLIAVRPGVYEFLAFLRATGKRRVLVTNAHPASLSLKMEVTGMAGWFDQLVSTHDYGHPKEEQAFWASLARDLSFEPGRTLFLDDTPRVLAAAQGFGIAHLWAIRDPDSRSVSRPLGKHPQVVSFAPLVLEWPMLP